MPANKAFWRPQRTASRGTARQRARLALGGCRSSCRGRRACDQTAPRAAAARCAAGSLPNPSHRLPSESESPAPFRVRVAGSLPSPSRRLPSES